ncbi:MAG: winged helix-turn-helix transcriptional regulator [Candidatus Bathyarchaeia archaeon]
MHPINATDLKILAELIKNSKASFVEIGKKLNLHPNVVAYRINKMENLGIIKEYTALIDLEKIGLSEQVCIGASFPEGSEKDKVLEQIATIPQILKVVSSWGSPEGIVFLVGKNKEDVDKAISKLRNLNVKIEYTASIIKTYRDGGLDEFLNQLAEEFGNGKDRKRSKNVEDELFKRTLEGKSLLV